MNRKDKRTPKRATQENRRRGNRRPSSPDRDISDRNSEDTISRGNKKVATSTATNNDPSWWNKFGNLAEIACNLSWNVMNGAPRNRDYTANVVTFSGQLGSSVLPTDMGISVIETVPCLGACRQIGDPINKAAIEIYNMVRWNKNANVPYDPADIAKLLWAYDSFISFLACMRRFYALTNAVDPRNRYVAKAIIRSLGADEDDLYTNRAQLVYKINELAIQAAKINIPAEFKVFDRHELLYDNIFIDSTVARGTYYAFVPRVLCKYNDQTLNLDYLDFLNSKYFDDLDTAYNASAITPPDTLPTGTPRWTVSTLSVLGDALLDAIQTSSDFYMLNANIYGAYSVRGLHPVKVIDSFYSITPMYREEVLSQIHNAEFADLDLTTLFVDENTTLGDPDLGAVRFRPSVNERSGISLGYNKIVDVPWESPSIDDVLEATRLKVTALEDPASVFSTTGWYIDSSGTEICTSMNTWYYKYSGGYWHLFWRQTRGWICDIYSGLSTSNKVVVLSGEASYLTKVDHYPICTLFTFTVDSSGNITAVSPFTQFGDMDNYAVIDTNQLQNIHTASLLSVLLNGPTVLQHPVSETK